MDKTTVITIAIIAVVLIVVIIIVSKIIMGIRNFLRTARSITHDIKEIADTAQAVGQMVKEAENAPDIVQPKTVGGATKLYEPRIMADFPSFHNPDAQSDIESVLRDYIMILHGNKISFTPDSVNDIVANSVHTLQKGSVSNIVFHNTAIYDYRKTMDFATVTYRTAFGYKLDGAQKEVRYEVAYTLSLREKGIATKNIICENCGASIDNFYNNTNKTIAKSNGVCPYCGTKIIRDTIMSWRVSNIKEIP